MSTKESSYSQVSIRYNGGSIDLNLHSQESLGLLIPTLVDHIRESVRQAGTNDDALEWLSDKSAAWSLANQFGDPYEPTRTLEDLNISDGSSLFLKKNSPKEKFPALIDDISEAIAKTESANFAEWDSTYSAKLAGLCLPFVALAASLGGAWASFKTGPDVLTHLAVASGLLFTAILSISLAVFLSSRKEAVSLSQTVSRGALCAGYILISSAIITILPREMSVYQLGAAGALIVVMSLLLKVPHQEAVTNAAFTIGISTVVTGVIGVIFSSLSPAGLAAVFAIIAINLVIESPRLSMVIAHIPMPFIPAPGEKFTDDRSKLSPDATSKAIESILNQEEKVISARWALLGISWGACICISAGAFISGYIYEPHPEYIIALFIVLALSMFFRGKSDSDAQIQKVELLGSMSCALSLMAGMIAGGRSPYMVLGIGAVMFIAGMVGSIISVMQMRIKSPLFKRMFEWLEMGLFASQLILLALLLDLYQKARGA